MSPCLSAGNPAPSSKFLERAAESAGEWASRSHSEPREPARQPAECRRASGAEPGGQALGPSLAWLGGNFSRLESRRMSLGAWGRHYPAIPNATRSPAALKQHAMWSLPASPHNAIPSLPRCPAVLGLRKAQDFTKIPDWKRSSGVGPHCAIPSRPHRATPREKPASIAARQTAG